MGFPLDYIEKKIKMPSDSKKREQQRKKDAQKKRNQKITTVTSSTNDEKPTNGTTNGDATNGDAVEMTEEGKLSIRPQQQNSN